jgi:hypothetical protein
MLAMLLAMTSRLVCWAFMPVAAMASAFMGNSSDGHAADVEIGRDDLVADGDCRLQRLLALITASTTSRVSASPLSAWIDICSAFCSVPIVLPTVWFSASAKEVAMPSPASGAAPPGIRPVAASVPPTAGLS